MKNLFAAAWLIPLMAAVTVTLVTMEAWAASSKGTAK